MSLAVSLLLPVAMETGYRLDLYGEVVWSRNNLCADIRTLEIVKEDE